MEGTLVEKGESEIAELELLRCGCGWTGTGVSEDREEGLNRRLKMISMMYGANIKVDVIP